jgi:hypothetical protein
LIVADAVPAGKFENVAVKVESNGPVPEDGFAEMVHVGGAIQFPLLSQKLPDPQASPGDFSSHSNEAPHALSNLLSPAAGLQLPPPASPFGQLFPLPQHNQDFPP